MLRVAVTGGIGSGKSTAAARLAALGAVVIDSDRLAREVVAVGTPGLAAIADRFGTAVINEDGSLNRPGLATIVFSDPDARRALEQITHPAVRRRFVELSEAAPAEAIVVNDIPLLTALPVVAGFHLVVGVGAETGLRIQRLIGRGLSEADARARLAAQIDDDARRPLTDVWIDNSGPADALSSQVEALWRGRLVPFDEALRRVERAPRPGPALAPVDPTWPATAERLMARVRRAAGDDVVSLDHIGSTAVPGLPAKDVIDLQLGVASLSDADRIAGALDAAGFVRQPGEWWDTRHPVGAAAAAWATRFHANCDPGRAVNLHVRVAGSPGWRWALAFRDWLSIDEAVRGEYLAVKQRLAAAHAGDVDTGAYAVAEEAWFADVAPRLEAWISATGWVAG